MDRLKVSIHELAFGGRGVGRLDDGRVVFVPFVAVGETVEVEIVRVHKSYLEGRLLKVENPSSHRVTPPCPYFGRCGGCSYQHLDMAEQATIKRQQVESVLRRIGRFDAPPVRPTVLSPRPYGYRNRITVHVREGTVGFFGHDEGRGNRRLLDIAQCPIAEPAVNEALTRLRSQRWQREGHCTLRAADAGHSGGGFQQTNDGAAAEMLAIVSELLPVDGKDPGKRLRLIDAYCGAGFFARHLRDRFEQVVGLEWDHRAVAQGKRGAAPNERYVCGDVAELLPAELEAAPASETVLILDPPSEGLADPVRRAVLATPPGEIIYVSCNPATLARDLATWQERYELLAVVPLDMFPQTAEIEVIAHLRLK